ncbi:hypothetical protein [Kitasatospora sp. CB01950]|uniref:hypothetical protein n=1 Tax=Kitasatospora sp. CB01950 TaxID=1703930 RepID=UPI00093D1ED1|nr:hypothetical protein [Kitasatospora sp. CB01950]OKJ17149.1 hypothetical protein AMK19_03340 [Kitasatospora sp. CB01950]
MAARVRTAAALLAATLLLAAASGCTGSGADGDSARPATPSPSGVQATPTDRSPHGVLLSAQLALHEARRSEFRATLGEDRAKGALFWAPKTVLQYRGDADTRRLMVMDTSAYVGGDPGTAARLGGLHWEKYTGSRSPYSALIDRISPVIATAAAAAADDPVLVGEEKLLDVTVQHYRVTLTADRYAAAQTQLDQGRRQALEAALGPGDVVLDLWLNDRDQLVQLRRAAAEVDTIGYSEFGSSAISVQAPAEADTVPESGATAPPFP